MEALGGKWLQGQQWLCIDSQLLDDSVTLASVAIPGRWPPHLGLLILDLGLPADGANGALEALGMEPSPTHRSRR